MKWYERYAKYHGFTINPDVEKNMSEYFALQQKNGASLYCPFKSRVEENVCPCEDLRKNYDCSCKFFVRKG